MCSRSCFCLTCDEMVTEKVSSFTVRMFTVIVSPFSAGGASPSCCRWVGSIVLHTDKGKERRVVVCCVLCAEEKWKGKKTLTRATFPFLHQHTHLPHTNKQTHTHTHTLTHSHDGSDWQEDCRALRWKQREPCADC